LWLRATCTALLAALILSMLAFSVRSFCGPFRIGSISVGSPVNAESIFGIALTLLLIARGRARPLSVRAREPLLRQGLLAVLVVILVYLSFYSIQRSYFLSDDFPLVQNSQRYIDQFPMQTGNVFFRPIGYLIVAVSSIWCGLDPSLWHVAGSLFHCACSVLVLLLVYRLYRSQWAALAAASVFGLHGSRPEAVVWLAGWFDVFSTFFILAGLLFFLGDAAEPRFTKRAAALVCMVLAMLSKETGFVFPLLLPVLIWTQRKLSRKDLPRLAPFFAVGLVVFSYRWLRLGGIGGYAVPATGEPQVFTFNVLGALKVLLLRLWAFLYFPVNWSGQPGLILAGILVAGAVSYVMLLASRPDRKGLLCAVGFVVVSALPALHQLLIGADMEKSRGLYLPSVGFALLLGLVLKTLHPVKLRLLVGGMILVLHFAVLQHNLGIWRRVSTLARQTCVSAARDIRPDTNRVVVRNLPGTIDGVYFFRNGFKECLEINSGHRIAEVTVDPAALSYPEDKSTVVLVWNEESEQIQVIEPEGHQSSTKLIPRGVQE